MEKVVITGATGFLGSSLAGLFLEKGITVYAVVRPGSAHMDALPVHPNLRVVYAGLDHILDCVQEIGQADAFFHFAWGGVNRAEIDSPVVQSENIRGSLDCVKAAHLLRCRVFMDAGSRVEYGVTEEKMAETLECHPVNEYGKAKWEFYRQAKPLCDQWGLSFYHLRFFSVYGYGDHPWSFISTLVHGLREEKAISLSACRHLWNFMYIDDAAEAVYELYRHDSADRKQSVIVNVASDDTRQLKDFAEEVKEIIGGRGSLEYGTFVQAKEGALSIQPVTDVLKELTCGEWRERYSFRQGILTMMKKEAEEKNEEN